MTVKEFYDSIGGDYEACLRTLMNDTFATKFINKFLNDQTYNNLVESFKTKDIDVMFRNAHTLKGVSLNLAFKKLGEKAVILTDVLREGSKDRENFNLLNKYLDDVTQEYNFVIESIKAFIQ